MQVTIPDDVVFRDLDGEAVLLHLGSGTYFGLDSVGTRIWQFLAENKSTDAIVPFMLREFEVDEDRLRQDIDALVKQLLARRLLITSDGAI